jgi:hypothetical protein
MEKNVRRNSQSYHITVGLASIFFAAMETTIFIYLRDQGVEISKLAFEGLAVAVILILLARITMGKIGKAYEFDFAANQNNLANLKRGLEAIGDAPLKSIAIFGPLMILFCLVPCFFASSIEITPRSKSFALSPRPPGRAPAAKEFHHTHIHDAHGLSFRLLDFEYSDHGRGECGERLSYRGHNLDRLHSRSPVSRLSMGLD